MKNPTNLPLAGLLLTNTAAQKTTCGGIGTVDEAVIELKQARAVHFARRLGLVLDAVYHAGEVRVYGFELTTGFEFIDLPNMSAAGYWSSWDAALQGLQQYLDEALAATSPLAMPVTERYCATVYHFPDNPARPSPPVAG